MISRASAATSFSVEDQPGIYYDGQQRLFRLRCKNSLYAFRVDDARNLEHLYWGPPVPPCDDITYLIQSHVPTPFDPKGSAESIAKRLGLEELKTLDTIEDITDKWKEYTRRRGPEVTEDIKRNRRLENASWRLWHQERNKGGDLNRDLSVPTVARLIATEDDPIMQHTKRPEDTSARAVKFPDSRQGNTIVEIHTLSDSKPRDPTRSPNPPKHGILKKPMKATKSMVDVKTLARQDSAFGPVRPTNRQSPTQAAQPSTAPSKSFLERKQSSFLERKPSSILARKSSRTLSSSASPRSLQRAHSQNYSSIGSSIGDMNLLEQSTNWGALDPEELGKNTKLLEFSDQGTGDYRDPSFKVNFGRDGSTVCPIRYAGYRISAGKRHMPSPMPSMYTDDEEEATTLTVEMEDSLTGLRFQLVYTVMHDYDIICRRTVVVNNGTSPVTLNHIVSGTFDFDAQEKHYMTQLAGGWARERSVVTQELDYGTKVVKSSRGASSHQFNPHIVISHNQEPTEEHGDCFGFTLVYSGNFAATCEVTEYGRLRVNMGINPEGFTWYLDTKKDSNTFYSPELVMSYSADGMGGLSRTLHRPFRERLIPRQWRYKVPPILINTWEAAYFNVSHEIVVEIAQAAVKAGIELLVLDDGWFGKRNDTTSGLGDWHPDLNKFPFGIEGVARAVNEIGLKFGIWVEPEMISLDSDLYRKHPDWCLCVPRRSRTTGRNQLVLDFSRQVVRDYIFEQLRDLIAGANITYIKWDMNRHLTEVFSQEWHATRQGEIAHRFILGVYDVLRKLTEAFPLVLFETCSGGGGRFDAGMLYFAPQIWASDNTDAISRVEIQYGTSLAYPTSTMGAHVSTVPNHQTLRSTPMKTRSLVAMSGTFGYELDPRVLTDDEFEEIRGYIEIQKRIVPLVYEGDLYRLWSPFKSDAAAWMFVSRDQQKAVVIGVSIRRVVGRLLPRLKLRGLLPDVIYRIEEACPGTAVRNSDTGAIDHDPRGVYQYTEALFKTGRTLQNAGLPVKFLFDADSFIFEISASNEKHSCRLMMN